MATAANQAKYIAKQQKFAAKMFAKGHEVTFGALRDGEYNFSAPGCFKELGKAYIFPSEWRSDFSKDVQTNDAIYFVESTMRTPSTAVIALFEDKPTHMIDADGKTKKIVHSVGFKPDGKTVIYWEIQVRL